MSDQAKFQKMLEMLLLLSGNFGYSIDELTDKFGKERRTIQRYIKTFRDAWLVINSRQGYYQIDKMCSEFKDISQLLHFSEEESHILSKAIHAIDDTNMVKSNLVKKLYSIYNDDLVVHAIVKPEHSTVVNQIVQAIKSKKQVELVNYQSSSSDSIKTRYVEPFDFTSNYISVWCYEPESASNKLFKIARIGKVEILPFDWQFTQAHNSGFVDVFRMTGLEQFGVQLKLTLRAKNLLVEEFPLAEKYITSLDEGKYLFEANVCNYDGVGRFVLGLCTEVIVLEPLALKQFLKEKLDSVSDLMS